MDFRFLDYKKIKSSNWWPFFRLVWGNIWRASRKYLGLLLFLVYINDFPLAVKCNCGLFADDSILHRKVTSESDCEDLQTDLRIKEKNSDTGYLAMFSLAQNYKVKLQNYTSSKLQHHNIFREDFGEASIQRTCAESTTGSELCRIALWGYFG